MAVTSDDFSYYMKSGSLTEMLNKALMAAGNTWGYAKVETDRITNIKGGHSNRSVLIEDSDGPEDASLKDSYDDELNSLLLEISTRMNEILDSEESNAWLGILWISGNFDAANHVFSEEKMKKLNEYYYSTLLSYVDKMVELNEELHDYLHAAPELLLYEPQKLKATLNSSGIRYTKTEFALIKELQKSLKKDVKSESKVLKLIGISKKSFDKLSKEVFNKLSSITNSDQYKILIESLILWEN